MSGRVEVKVCRASWEGGKGSRGGPAAYSVPWPPHSVATERAEGDSLAVRGPPNGQCQIDS